MATYIFGGLTAAVLALSIWMGIKNNNELEQLLKQKKQSETALAKQQEELDEQTRLFKKAQSEKEEALTASEAKEEELSAITSENEALSASLMEKENNLPDRVKKIEEGQKILSELPDPDLLLPQIKATKKKIATLKAEVKSAEESLSATAAKEKSLAALVVKKQEMIDFQTSGKSLAALSTTIKSVYSNWGFVTLSGGNAQGVVPSSILEVLRGGEVIAKLKVTAVEQNRAVADILPDSSSDRLSLKVGDRVVAGKAAQ